MFRTSCITTNEVARSLVDVALTAGIVCFGLVLCDAGRALWVAALASCIVSALFAIGGRARRANAMTKAATTFAGRCGPYTLGEKIGQGGMGEVYRAHHALMDRDVAIKVLPAALADEEARARFEREVRLTSRFESPNTVAVHDSGRTPDGRPYYVMELVDGYDLEALVRKFGPQSPGRVVHLLDQICAALEEVHAAGLVHRDIKPANIAICERVGVKDVVKVLDFGLVGEVGAISPSERRGLVGTPAYLAPESILAPESVDGRVDLYALGAVAYWLLTGTQVFGGSSLVEICSHHVHSMPEPPNQRLGSAIPSDLEAVILRCLAKDPADRFENAHALREALAACISSAEWSSSMAATWWQKHETPERDAAGADASITLSLAPVGLPLDLRAA
jgi:eukaryotic-like serine/threonine-protein kinase